MRFVPPLLHDLADLQVGFNLKYGHKNGKPIEWIRFWQLVAAILSLSNIQRSQSVQAMLRHVGAPIEIGAADDPSNVRVLLALLFVLLEVTSSGALTHTVHMHTVCTRTTSASQGELW